jgi:hypothetical protein
MVFGTASADNRLRKGERKRKKKGYGYGRMDRGGI